jgi:hypothetical protein
MAKTNDSKPNGYALSRAWFDFAFENPDLVNCNHTALYMWLIELNNRKGFVVKFPFNTEDACVACGVKNRKTIWKAMNELVDFGFVTMIHKSADRHKATVISIVNNSVVSEGYLDKSIKINSSKIWTGKETVEGQVADQLGDSERTGTGTVSGHSLKQENNKPETKKPISGKTTFSPPTHIDVCNYFSERVNETKWTDHDCNFQAKKFIDFYSSKNWMVGKNKMANWKSAASGWINRAIETKVTTVDGQKPQKGFQAAMDMYNKLKL